MQKALTALVAFATLALAGCGVTAGQFVTNIRSDGMGKLTIEKCNIYLNAFMGDMDRTDCKEMQVQVNGQATSQGGDMAHPLPLWPGGEQATQQEGAMPGHIPDTTATNGKGLPGFVAPPPTPPATK